MALQAKDLTDAVLQRVRDPGGLAHPRELVRRLLDRTQCAVQAAAPGWVLQITLTTQPAQLIYPIASFADASDEDHPPCIRVERVTADYPPRDLVDVPWRTLAQTDRHWLRRTGSKLLTFSRLGRDHLILYPALKESVLCSILYTPVPTALGAEDVPLELREDRLPAVAALTEMLLLLRQRTPGAVKTAQARFLAAMSRLPKVRGTGVAGFGQGGFGVEQGVP